VSSQPAAVIAAGSIRIGRQAEPGIIGVAVGGWCYGLAGASVPTAVQVVA
jgi:hypothetical protein